LGGLDGLLPAPLTSVGGQPLVASRNESPSAGCREIERLYAALGQITPESCPRTFKLLDSSTPKISQKVIEEAGEVALEAVKHHASGVAGESADLLYHLVVFWPVSNPLKSGKRCGPALMGLASPRSSRKRLAAKAAAVNSNRSTLNEQEG
jgi:phosphoribosyl-ATP pyrophosphohydrolase